MSAGCSNVRNPRTQARPRTHDNVQTAFIWESTFWTLLSKCWYLPFLKIFATTAMKMPPFTTIDIPVKWHVLFNGWFFQNGYFWFKLSDWWFRKRSRLLSISYGDKSFIYNDEETVCTYQSECKMSNILWVYPLCWRAGASSSNHLYNYHRKTQQLNPLWFLEWPPPTPLKGRINLKIQNIF